MKDHERRDKEKKMTSDIFLFIIEMFKMVQ